MLKISPLTYKTFSILNFGNNNKQDDEIPQYERTILRPRKVPNYIGLPEDYDYEIPEEDITVISKEKIENLPKWMKDLIEKIPPQKQK